MTEEISADETRRKRMKFSDDAAPDAAAPVSSLIPEQSADITDAQALKEAAVGITNFVSPDLPGFSGILKKRYTDFLVNEILPSGEVLHLKKLEISDSIKAITQAPAPAPKPTSDKPVEKSTPVLADDTQTKEKTQGAVEVSEKENVKEVGDGSETAAKEQAAATSKEAPPFTISAEDNEQMNQLFGAEIAQKIIHLHERALAKPYTRPGDLGRINSGIFTSKEQRTTIHQTLRRIFQGRLESITEKDENLLISAAPPSIRRDPAAHQARANANGKGGQLRRGKVGWGELGGDYLHFSIYKENKDTMEVMSFIGRQLKLGSKIFQFAGTKDRRGVTVQRASGFRVYPERMERMNKMLRNAVVGDFEYHKQGLELGDLAGNEFVITLRDCQFPSEVTMGGKGTDEESVARATELVGKSLRDLRERGYFNYYGLQRFGTFATRTDTTGVKMLQGDFKGACESLLDFNASALAAAEDNNTTDTATPSSDTTPKPMISIDDISRAEAIQIFKTTGNAHKALEKLPRKLSAESNIIRHLGQNKNDYIGALKDIPRNLRLMYVHAYQSLVWNFAAGERWRLYGDKVVAGDLVMVKEFKEEESNKTDMVDADGEAIVLPDAGDSGLSPDDMFDRARALTAEEAASGRYSIFDIVLPQPGFDILYPANEMTEFYKRFMASDKGGNLDPFDMRRSWRDISLSGGYRKLLSRPGADYSFEVKQYKKDDEQFVSTDLEKIKASGQEGQKQEANNDGDKQEEEEEDKLAVVLKFQLGPSQYATMALRELMKTGGAKTFKPGFSRD